MSDETPPHLLPPGRRRAVDLGCTCYPNDGEPVDNARWPEWMVADCPVHGSGIANSHLDP